MHNPFEGKELQELATILQLKLQQQKILQKFINAQRLDAIQMRLHSGKVVELISFTDLVGIPEEVTPFIESLYNRLAGEIMMIEAAMDK
jgi:hypothetical protein